MLSVTDLYNLLQEIKKSVPLDEGCQPFFACHLNDFGAIMLKTRGVFVQIDLSEEDLNGSYEIVKAEIIKNLISYIDDLLPAT